MSDDECIHGMNPAWCANCADRGRAAASPAVKAGGDRNAPTKIWLTTCATFWEWPATVSVRVAPSRNGLESAATG